MNGSCIPRSSTRSTLPQYEGGATEARPCGRLAAESTTTRSRALQTDRVGFYDRLGWELWQGPLAGRGEDGLIPTPDQQGVMVLRLPRTPPLRLDTRLTIEPQPERIWE